MKRNVVQVTSCALASALLASGAAAAPISEELPVRRGDRAPGAIMQKVSPTVFGGPAAVEVSLDMVDLLSTTGFVAEGTEADAQFGRLSLRFNPGVEHERPYALDDLAYDPIQDFADPEDRMPIGLADVANPLRGGNTIVGGQGVDVRYYSGFAPSTTIGDFEVQVRPQASLTVRDDVSGAGAGAMVRFGRNLTEPRHPDETGGWYIFAGADAQALTWRLEPGMRFNDAVRLEDRTLVGDAEAGIAFRVGPADIALAVVHRDIRYRDYSTDEQFAGVSVSMTR